MAESAEQSPKDINKEPDDDFFDTFFDDGVLETIGEVLGQRSSATSHDESSSEVVALHNEEQSSTDDKDKEACPLQPETGLKSIESHPNEQGIIIIKPAHLKDPFENLETENGLKKNEISSKDSSLKNEIPSKECQSPSTSVSLEPQKEVRGQEPSLSLKDLLAKVQNFLKETPRSTIETRKNSDKEIELGNIVQEEDGEAVTEISKTCHKQLIANKEDGKEIESKASTISKSDSSDEDTHNQNGSSSKRLSPLGSGGQPSQESLDSATEALMLEKNPLKECDLILDETSSKNQALPSSPAKTNKININLKSQILASRSILNSGTSTILESESLISSKDNSKHISTKSATTQDHSSDLSTDDSLTENRDSRRARKKRKKRERDRDQESKSSEKGRFDKKSGEKKRKRTHSPEYKRSRDYKKSSKRDRSRSPVSYKYKSKKEYSSRRKRSPLPHSSSSSSRHSKHNSRSPARHRSQSRSNSPAYRRVRKSPSPRNHRKRSRSRSRSPFINEIRRLEKQWEQEDREKQKSSRSDVLSRTVVSETVVQLQRTFTFGASTDSTHSTYQGGSAPLIPPPVPFPLPPPPNFSIYSGTENGGNPFTMAPFGAYAPHPGVPVPGMVPCMPGVSGIDPHQLGAGLALNQSVIAPPQMVPAPSATKVTSCNTTEPQSLLRRQLDILLSVVPPVLPPTMQPALLPTMPLVLPSALPPSVSPALPPSVSPALPPSVPLVLPPAMPPRVSPDLPPTVPLVLPPSVSPDLPPTVPLVLPPTMSPDLPPTVPLVLPPTMSPDLPPTVSPALRPTVASALPPAPPKNLSPSLVQSGNTALKPKSSRPSLVLIVDNVVSNKSSKCEAIIQTCNNNSIQASAPEASKGSQQTGGGNDHTSSEFQFSKSNLASAKASKESEEDIVELENPPAKSHSEKEVDNDIVVDYDSDVIVEEPPPKPPIELICLSGDEGEECNKIPCQNCDSHEIHDTNEESNNGRSTTESKSITAELNPPKTVSTVATTAPSESPVILESSQTLNPSSKEIITIDQSRPQLMSDPSSKGIISTDQSRPQLMSTGSSHPITCQNANSRAERKRRKRNRRAKALENQGHSKATQDKTKKMQVSEYFLNRKKNCNINVTNEEGVTETNPVNSKLTGVGSTHLQSAPAEKPLPSESSRNLQKASEDISTPVQTQTRTQLLSSKSPSSVLCQNSTPMEEHESRTRKERKTESKKRKRSSSDDKRDQRKGKENRKESQDLQVTNEEESDGYVLQECRDMIDSLRIGRFAVKNQDCDEDEPGKITDSIEKNDSNSPLVINRVHFSYTRDLQQNPVPKVKDVSTNTTFRLCLDVCTNTDVALSKDCMLQTDLECLQCTEKKELIKDMNAQLIKLSMERDELLAMVMGRGKSHNIPGLDLPMAESQEAPQNVSQRQSGSEGSSSKSVCGENSSSLSTSKTECFFNRMPPAEPIAFDYNHSASPSRSAVRSKTDSYLCPKKPFQ